MQQTIYKMTYFQAPKYWIFVLKSKPRVRKHQSMFYFKQTFTKCKKTKETKFINSVREKTPSLFYQH